MSYASLDAYSRKLRVAHEAARTGATAPDGTPRRLISASWRRSLAAGIDPDGTAAPLVYDVSHLDEVRESHPLQPLLPMLAGTLTTMADASANIAIITDRDGNILWRDGNRAVMRRADLVGLADGHTWAETSVGTNGIGTALADRKPVHVYSEEHLLKVLHVWSCSAAPIVDPDTDEVLGCIDISGTAPSLHPATVALVSATAKLAESQLALRMHEGDERLRRRFDGLRDHDSMLITATGRVIAGDPAGLLGRRVPIAGDRILLPGGRAVLAEPFHDGYLVRVSTDRIPPTLQLTFLGEGQPTARLSGREIPLSLRHAEILALLALHPRGLTAEQLCFYLYGDAGNPVTIRAEIHRLRAQLGETVGAKPYRLTSPVEADFIELRSLLGTGDPAAVARAYPGPLLPRSESPELRRARDELEVQVRANLLRNGSPEDLWIYAQTASGRDDLQILERLSTTLPATDPRAITARIRLRTP
ncbi:helix-turn-helix domain-containing protein [Nonomuraea typhae]|uniref:helix-turn-helix domain-containing protein n=1 Tax=Nonomuraea typhae TaxID=2603600 RepID=UPI0015E1DCB3|nr:helix-turn-helix domain-containing protein [Nonomuraea typhae]